jgi:hypothetical protein
MRPQVQPTLALDIGDGRDELRCRHPIGWTVLGALVAALPATWMWGFTVDDALISVRYARHLAAGLGWRFNAGGPSTDGVTPLPWPFLLAPFALGRTRCRCFTRAKSWASAWYGRRELRSAALSDGRRHRESRLRGPWARRRLRTSRSRFPLAAHAVSGMETAVATSLATFACARRRPRRPLLAALIWRASPRRSDPRLARVGLATLAVGVAHAQVAEPVARASRRPPRAAAVRAARWYPRIVAWGHPAPLALLAKPSDLAHGRSCLRRRRHASSP